jgi:anaerobic ribonucleoside-triphosphate reductase activating protein
MHPQPRNPWQTGGLPQLNVAATCPATRVLGPGVRAVVWVQGCPFDCAGCVAPDWIPFRQEHLRTPDDIAAECLACPEVSGLTFSGGEPMLQAAGLVAVVRVARGLRDLSLICFTGFTLERLRAQPPGPGVGALLDEIDVLIDGRYVAARNDNRGMRGSSNQRVHYLTDRITARDYNFASQPRQVEIHVNDGAALLVGVPPVGLPEAFEQAIDRANTTLRNALRGGSS